MKQTPVRVRYAPSPTGFLHIGNARTALFNFLFARAHQGKFIIRTENTDLNRNLPHSIEAQVDTLRWLGIVADESQFHPGAYGPYEQLQRLTIYQKWAQKLLVQKKVYLCFCSPDVLAVEKQQSRDNNEAYQYSQKCLRLSTAEINDKLAQKIPYAYRWKVDRTVKHYQFNDLIRGKITFRACDLGDWVIIKPNNIPTYNFAVAIDDWLMKITHVIRGEEHISNTPYQLMVFHAISALPPVYAHLNLILDDNNKKLSKRNFQKKYFINYFREQGFLPTTITSYLALLGWNPGNKQELFTLSELIAIFNAHRFSKGASHIHWKRIDFLGKKDFQKLSSMQYLELVLPLIKKTYSQHQYNPTQLSTIAVLYHRHLSHARAIIPAVAVFFPTKQQCSSELLANARTLNVTKTQIEYFYQKINRESDWSLTIIQQLITAYQTKFQVTKKLLYMPLRMMCTLAIHGPELPQMLLLLGRSRVAANILFFKTKIAVS